MALALSIRLSLEELEALALKAQQTADALEPHDSVSRCGAKIPCTLLDTDTNTCMAYEERPHACRGYNSISADDCEKGFGDPSAKVGVESTQQMIYSGASLGLMEGLKQVHTMFRTPVELNKGLAKALSLLIRDAKQPGGKPDEPN